MEFLVEFDVTVPPSASPADVTRVSAAEAVAAAKLAADGHLVRVWRTGSSVLGLYRAESRTELDGLLGALPLHDWMRITVTPLAPHPNDPAVPQSRDAGLEGADVAVNAADPEGLPLPRLTAVYRLEATLDPPLDLGEVAAGRRRIAHLTGGTFTGPQLNGTLVPGSSADWQILRPDGTALGDIRYTLRTEAGDLLYVQSTSVRHGSPEVLARLGRGEQVDPHEYVFRAATRIEAAAPALDWLNKGVFVTVGARGPAGVIYETYLAQ